MYNFGLRSMFLYYSPAEGEELHIITCFTAFFDWMFL